MSHILHETSNEIDQTVLGPPVTVEIYRYVPSETGSFKFQIYEVPYQNRMSVFTLKRIIYEKLDPSLAFRNQQCGRGICGTCKVRISLDRLGYKDKLVNGCSVVLEPGDHLVIKPASEGKVIRDVVVEF
jgi:succinate dehydrogenase/fumarate reductase-like Fe-S protein